MLRGISSWCFPSSWDLEQCAQVCADAEIEAWEFGFGDEGPVGLAGTPETARQAQDLLAKYGISVCSVIGGGPLWNNPATSCDPDVRARAKQATRQILQQAQAMGLATASIVPGAVQNIFDPSCPVVPYEVAYDNLSRFLKEMAPEAAKLKVRLLIENVWNKFLYSPLELCRMVDEIESEWVGVHYDTGNTLLYGVSEDYIRLLGKRIGMVHVKDWKFNPGGLNGFCPLLQGDTNWPAVTAALRAISYDGALVAEIGPPYTHYPEVLIHHTSLALRAIIEGGLAEGEE